MTLINNFLKFFFLFIFLVIFQGCKQESFAIITNQGEDTISIVDLQNLNIIKTIQTNPGPLAVEILKNNLAIISNTKNESLQLIDLDSLKIIDTINLGFTPLGIVYVEGKDLLYISSWYENKLYYYNTNTWERDGVIPVGKTPSGIIYDKKRDQIIVSNRDENLLTIIQDNKVIKTIEVGDHPFGVYLLEDSVFSVNVYSNDVSKIDLNTFDSSKFNVGDHPYNIISSDHYIFVTNTQDDSVSVINKDDFSILKTLKTGEVPENLGVDLLNNQLIVTNWGSNSISIFNLDTLKLKKEIPTGRESRSFGNFIWAK